MHSLRCYSTSPNGVLDDYCFLGSATNVRCQLKEYDPIVGGGVIISVTDACVVCKHYN